ncbi:unnamed protein product [Phytomonas sp. Hart1]|nr:unnamed protein product [Phytomonas sp. Hart1]|eukprot:CCW68131.1 unnamed protein product [Phytomonas sp. isolate Hart1]
MLWKQPYGRHLTTFVVHSPLFRQARRFFAIRSTSFLLDGSSPNSKTITAPSTADEEDHQELERERKLRERFTEKVQQSFPQTQGRSEDGKRESSTNIALPNNSTESTGSSIFNFFLALLLLYSLLLLFRHGSQMADLQRIPWRELPIVTVACFLLLNTLYSSKDKMRIKNEFQDASQKNPYLTFDQFIAQRYPNLFEGYHASQAEAIAAVSACLVVSKDLKLAITMLRAVRNGKDTRASVDALLEALRKDFPNVF